ncbi:MAG: CPBP family intramembrane glutamic endopeptidase [Puniceicoccales bacterium]
MDLAEGMLALVGAYPLVLLALGLFWLVQDARGELTVQPPNSLPAWNTRWPEFLLFLTGSAFLVIVLSSLATNATVDWETNSVLEAWRMPVVGLVFQLTMLAIIVVGFQPKTNFLTFKINPRLAPKGEVFRAGFHQFVISIPLVFVFAAGWEGLLKLANFLGFPVSLERQELLELFDFNQPIALTILLLVTAIVIAPVTEELLFRGVIYRFLKGRFSARSSAISSSLIFSAIHGYEMSFLPLFLLGMLLCRSYEKEHNILAPIFFHALFNANTIALLFLAQALTPS